VGLTDNLLKKGFKITLFSTGKPFDPSKQKRTTAKQDILKKRKEKENEDNNISKGL
jgi:hypothetical protein